MKICGCSIMKNELETGHLERWLYNMGPLCDELVVVDDQSEDGTREHLIKMGVKVLSGDGDFSNELTKIGMLFNNIESDLSLFLDADEVLDKRLQSRNALSNLTNNNDYDYISLKLVNMWENDGNIRTDGNFFGSTFPRVLKTNSYKGIVGNSGLHKKCNLLKGGKKGTEFKDFFLLHYGFFTRSLRKRKENIYRQYGQTDHWYVDEKNAKIENLIPVSCWK